MFYKYQPAENKKRYIEQLRIAGALSRLYSDNQAPYLVSRLVENVFCDAFNAENLSRSDCSVDAKFGRVGIGIKTFLHTSKLQKVAEFNKDSPSYKHLSKVEKIERIAELRNERLETTKRIYGVDTLVYHYITREKGRINIYEEAMQMIDIPNIKNVIETKTSITFEDGNNRYSFNLSKSTLMKHFDLSNAIDQFDVNIVNDPMEMLRSLVIEDQESFTPNLPDVEFLILALYSIKGSKKVVHPKSGLNQWNAAGRKRDFNEVYIPIPSMIHKTNPDFFPLRDQPFNLRLPNGAIMSAKVCQDNSKALMSNPNKALGKWLLRDVLDLQEGELLIYERLQEIGLDSVIIYKYSDDDYAIDFREVGTYEEFIERSLDIDAEEE
jgi:hypothetical protein